MKARIFTDDKFAAIPELVAQGKGAAEIAEMFGVKVGTLKVYCSQRHISLRRPAARPYFRKSPQLRTEIALIVSLHLEAKARGLSKTGLVSQLIEIIAKDRLYDAVLGKVGEMEAA